MELLSELGKIITGAGQEVAGQTGKLAEKARISSKISGVEKRLSKELMVLGKEYYKEHHTTGNHPSLETVTNLRTELKALQKELSTLHGVRICPQCDAQVGISFSFCQHCGTTMSRKAEVQQSEDMDDVIDMEDVDDSEILDLSQVVHLEKEYYEE